MDAQLGPHTRRLLYYHVLRDRATTLRLMGGAGPAWEQAALPWIFPIVRGLMRHLMRIDSDGAQQSRQAIDTIFAEVAARLAGGQRYLVGDQFSAADLTFAALAAPVVWPPEYGGGAVELPALSSLPKELAATIGELQQTPAGQFALRIYRDQRQPPPAVPA
jgi:glutathione S-transferase